jgi:hypothetical protein
MIIISYYVDVQGTRICEQQAEAEDARADVRLPGRGGAGRQGGRQDQGPRRHRHRRQALLTIKTLRSSH